MLSFENLVLCIYEIEVSTSLPWLPPNIFFFGGGGKLVFKFLYSPSQKGHVIKHGLDWIGKTWTGLTKHGVIKHGLIKQGVI